LALAPQPRQLGESLTLRVVFAAGNIVVVRFVIR